MPEFKIPLRDISGKTIAYSLVDEEDFEKVNKVKWCLSNNYAFNSTYGYLQRFIMNAKKEDMLVDHINGNKLDNRKENLRFASGSQNSQNRYKKIGSSSKYIGVSYFYPTNKWRCQTLDIVNFFDVEEHAAWWYDQTGAMAWKERRDIQAMLLLPHP